MNSRFQFSPFTRQSSAWFALWLLCLTAPQIGCISFNIDTARSVAKVVSWGQTSPVKVRKTPRNPLTDQLNLMGWGGPKPTDRTMQLLRRYDLELVYEEDPSQGLTKLHQECEAEPTLDKLNAFAELSYLQAKKFDAKSNHDKAFDLYAASLGYAYRFLFSPDYDMERNPYDPEFRGACDLYNSSLEGLLRIMKKKGDLRPGYSETIETCGHRINFVISNNGDWHDDDFERFEFVSDFDVNGLNNHYHTYGLGVPLIAIRKKHETPTVDEQFYPTGLAFPVTAFFRAVDIQKMTSSGVERAHNCALELHDPLTQTDVQLSDRVAPLESDTSTPLAYFLNDPLLSTQTLATFALLSADFAKDYEGLYMLEPFDPEKIPVLLVHGLWSSPTTWMDMYNDLQSMKELRDNYQFWFYLYPTGQSFWISATQMRADLDEARDQLDPQRQYKKLDQMVLVGHSMGGLVSKLQTIESGNRFWNLLSKRPFEELVAPEETKHELQQTLFFHPNPSIKRVVTMGTPHRGSHFSNQVTRYLSHYLFDLPSIFTNENRQLLKKNPDFFVDTHLLTINTSIDSLSPASPILPAMLEAETAPWVTFHNIVGRVPDRDWVGKLGQKVAGTGDGVVSLASATLDNAESQIEVAADHVNIHQHPKAILEIRRILLQHLAESNNQSWDENVVPASRTARAETQSAPHAKTERVQQVAPANVSHGSGAAKTLGNTFSISDDQHVHQPTVDPAIQLYQSRNQAAETEPSGKGKRESIASLPDRPTETGLPAAASPATPRVNVPLPKPSSQQLAPSPTTNKPKKTETIPEAPPQPGTAEPTASAVPKQPTSEPSQDSPTTNPSSTAKSPTITSLSDLDSRPVSTLKVEGSTVEHLPPSIPVISNANQATTSTSASNPIHKKEANSPASETPLSPSNQ